jgi:hypothetical protein
MMGIATADWASCLVDNLSVAFPVTETPEGVIDQMAAPFGRTLPMLPGAIGAVRRRDGSAENRRRSTDGGSVGVS